MSRRKVVMVQKAEGGRQKAEGGRRKAARPQAAPISQENVLKDKLGAALKSGRHLVVVAWDEGGLLHYAQTSGRFPLAEPDGRDNLKLVFDWLRGELQAARK